jgi:mono/diheme cytochrome c family protein
MSASTRPASSSTARVRGAAALVCGMLLASATLLAQPPAPTADAQRGAPLFADKYNCYACHGFDAQTGERRLVPLNYTQEGFITFVQQSPLPQMPAFPDVPAQDLADIYAYIRSLPADAPPLADLPLLRGIRDRKLEALAK